MYATRQTTRFVSSLRKPAINARPITSSNIFTIAATSQYQIYPLYHQTQTRGYVADRRPFKDGSLSQGHSDPKNLRPQDTGSQAVKGGFNARHNTKGGQKEDGGDAAMEQPQGHARGGKGNPEGIGMVDQVGSSSGSSRHFEELEREK